MVGAISSFGRFLVQTISKNAGKIGIGTGVYTGVDNITECGIHGCGYDDNDVPIVSPLPITNPITGPINNTNNVSFVNVAVGGAVIYGGYRLIKRWTK